MTWPPLRFVSYLSAHHDAVADLLARRLSEQLGVDTRVVGGPHPDRRRLIEDGAAEIVWMCGFLTRRLLTRGALDADIVAAPIFSGETQPVYRTLVVVPAHSDDRRLADLGGKRAVINEDESWSGCHALVDHLGTARLPFFSDVTRSGSHAASVDRVLAGQADCTALDSSLWRLLPDEIRGRLRIVDRTRDWPSPPFSVTRRLDAGLQRRIVSSLETAQPDSTVTGIAAVSGDLYDEMQPRPPLGP